MEVRPLQPHSALLDRKFVRACGESLRERKNMRNKLQLRYQNTKWVFVSILCVGIVCKNITMILISTKKHEMSFYKHLVDALLSNVGILCLLSLYLWGVLVCMLLAHASWFDEAPGGGISSRFWEKKRNDKRSVKKIAHTRYKNKSGDSISWLPVAAVWREADCQWGKESPLRSHRTA